VQVITRTRKKMALWSAALAAWSSIGLILVLTGAMAAFNESFSLVCFFVWFFSPFAGLALSMFAISRDAPNPKLVWVAMVSNAALIIAWIFRFAEILRHGQG